MARPIRHVRFAAVGMGDGHALGNRDGGNPVCVGESLTERRRKMSAGGNERGGVGGEPPTSTASHTAFRKADQKYQRGCVRWDFSASAGGEDFIAVLSDSDSLQPLTFSIKIRK